MDGGVEVSKMCEISACTADWDSSGAGRGSTHKHSSASRSNSICRWALQGKYVSGGTKRVQNDDATGLGRHLLLGASHAQHSIFMNFLKPPSFGGSSCWTCAGGCGRLVCICGSGL